uniref:Hairy and enhancer of split 5 n=1 Tax=Nothobranchius kuhntae TaxID=321403 RepID=A0A1A8K2Y6_NOTKU
MAPTITAASTQDQLTQPQAEEASGGEVTQRENQQQHRAAQVSPGSRVPQTAARLQAGESRHPGDDRLCPDTTAAAEPEAEKTSGPLQ